MSRGWRAKRPRRSFANWPARRPPEKEPGRQASLVVLGADTTVALDNHILGKPEDAADAARMLRLLSGRTHRVITGVAVVTEKGAEVAAEATAVRFFDSVRRRDCRLRSRRRTDGQGRRLCHPGPRGALDSAHRGLLLQRDGPAPGAGLLAAGVAQHPHLSHSTTYLLTIPRGFFINRKSIARTRRSALIRTSPECCGTQCAWARPCRRSASRRAPACSCRTYRSIWSIVASRRVRLCSSSRPSKSASVCSRSGTRLFSCTPMK